MGSGRPARVASAGKSVGQRGHRVRGLAKVGRRPAAASLWRPRASAGPVRGPAWQCGWPTPRGDRGAPTCCRVTSSCDSSLTAGKRSTPACRPCTFVVESSAEHSGWRRSRTPACAMGPQRGGFATRATSDLGQGSSYLSETLGSAALRRGTVTRDCPVFREQLLRGP